MSSRLHNHPFAIALILLIQSFGLFSSGQASAQQPATTLSNSISGLTVTSGQDGQWLLEFDYVFSGEVPAAAFRLQLMQPEGTERPMPVFDGRRTRVFPPKPGAHHVAVALEYPGEGTTDRITLMMTAPQPDGISERVLASKTLDQLIEWPSREETDLDLAYSMIENGSRDMLREARSLLERLIAKNPKLDAAYVELARIAMKSNWGQEGLHQAEALLDSALKIRPDNVNAKILLGYVYAHQNRFEQAEDLLVDAAREDTPNLWLWTNWGELLEMQGKTDLAIGKYREAIARPYSLKYSSGRTDAYQRLLRLLEARNDADGMEAVYEQRLDEYGPHGCIIAKYARFKLQARGDAQGAIDLARSIVSLDCENTLARETLGLASYVKWAEGSGAESVDALHEARIFLPAGPTALYLLASSASSMSAAKKLLAGGEAIDQKDNEEMTALALALQDNELEAAERLLGLGARPETPVTPAAIPVAFLPVLDGNFAAIDMMRRAGVNYSNLRYRGATALDFAKQVGDDELLEALAPRNQTL